MEGDTIRSLFDHAMNDEWEKIVEVCKNTRDAQEAKVTKSGDTALHLAIYSRKDATAKQMIDNVASQDVGKILGIANDRGNTVLHLAAALGMAEMCEHIVSKVSEPEELIRARNKDGETPLFLAALHGEKETFTALHSLCSNHEDASHCRRTDGNTILHCAILGEYFDLAFVIFRLYPTLTIYRNEKGHSALHVLAAQPSCFKSGSRLGRLDSIIYKYLSFDDETVDPCF